VCVCVSVCVCVCVRGAGALTAAALLECSCCFEQCDQLQLRECLGVA
jgi:hypothetical protein